MFIHYDLQHSIGQGCDACNYINIIQEIIRQIKNRQDSNVYNYIHRSIALNLITPHYKKANIDRFIESKNIPIKDRKPLYITFEFDPTHPYESLICFKHLFSKDQLLGTSDPNNLAPDSKRYWYNNRITGCIKTRIPEALILPLRIKQRLYYYGIIHSKEGKVFELNRFYLLGGKKGNVHLGMEETVTVDQLSILRDEIKNYGEHKGCVFDV